MKISCIFVALLLMLVGIVFAAHPPKTTITKYTYESKLNPNKFIKWDILENESRGHYSWRVVQKDDQVILLRFYTGILTGYAYYLNDKLCIYANGESGRTHFMEDPVTPAKKTAIDSWLDSHRTIKL